jgi:hypothetical protein
MDRPTVQEGLDRGEIQQILAVRPGFLVQPDHVRARVKRAPPLEANGDKQCLDASVIGCGDDLSQIAGGPLAASTCELSVGGSTYYNEVTGTRS